MPQFLSKLKNLKKRLSSLSAKQTLSLVFFLAILISLPLVSWAVLNQKMQVGKRAAETPSSVVLPETRLISKTVAEQLADGSLKLPSQILEVELHYEAKNPGLLTVLSMTKKNGYPSVNPPKDGQYSFILLTETNLPLITQKFIIPNELKGPPPLSSLESSKSVISFDQIDFAITLPWIDNAVRYQIKTPTGTVISDQKLPTINTLNNQIQFSSLITDSKRTTIQSSSSDGFFDIAIIGDDFSSSELVLYHIDIQKFTTQFFKYQPYKIRSSQIRFNLIDNTNDLECGRHWPEIPRVVDCSDDKVIKTVNNYGAPWDEIIVIVKDPAYGGSYSQVAVAADQYNGYNEYDSLYTQAGFPRNSSYHDWSQDVFVHELSHGLTLLDEYGFGPGNYGSVSDPNLNCHSGSIPNSAWSNFVSNNDYYLECSSPNWYRPSETSIMRAIDQPYFNIISLNRINSQLNDLSGPFPPGEDPVPNTTIISHQENQTVFGAVTLNISSTNLAYINHFELWLDGVLFKTIYPAQYQSGFSSNPPWNFDSLNLSEGSHSFQIKAFNGLGHTGQSQTIHLYILHSPPTPTLTPTPTPTPIPTPTLTPTPFPAVSYSLTSKISCPVGQVVSGQTRNFYAFWPPPGSSTLTWNYGPYKVGQQTLSVTTPSGGSSLLGIYFGLKTLSQTALIPSGTPPHSAIEYATHFNPPAWMAHWTRFVPSGNYNLTFQGNNETCAIPTPTPTPFPPSAPQIMTTSLKSGTVNQYYSAIIQAVDKNPEDTLTMTIALAPPSLTLGRCQALRGTTSTAINCEIKGIPRMAGLSAVKVNVKDNRGLQTIKYISITINPATQPTPPRSTL